MTSAIHPCERAGFPWSAVAALALSCKCDGNVKQPFSGAKAMLAFTLCRHLKISQNEPNGQCYPSEVLKAKDVELWVIWLLLLLWKCAIKATISLHKKATAKSL